LFTAVGWWWGQAASLWCETPLLNVGFDEYKSHLAKIDVYLAWAIRTNCGEEILGLEAMCDVIKLLAVAGKEEGSGARAVSDANNVSLYVCWAVRGRCKGLVVSSVSIGHVRY
jgi:hypothetical protein